MRRRHEAVAVCDDCQRRSAGVERHLRDTVHASDTVTTDTDTEARVPLTDGVEDAQDVDAGLLLDGCRHGLDAALQSVAAKVSRVRLLHGEQHVQLRRRTPTTTI